LSIVRFYWFGSWRLYCFMDRKRAEGKHYYVYIVAGAAKFLRIYYARVKEYLNAQDAERISVA